MSETSRKADDDSRELAFHAVDAVESALWDGKNKYGVGHWLTVSMHDHIDHILMHLKSIIIEGVSFQDIDHILCRVAMLRAKLNREKTQA